MHYAIKKQLNNEEREKLAPFSSLLAHLLFHRGIKEIEMAQKYLNPNYDKDTFDPYLFKDMEKAVERLLRAIKNDEKIAIYADYDADGIPGAAMFADFFHKINYHNFTVYIPHRHEEGFGLNNDAILHLLSLGTKLIITIDCGIADKGPVSLAREKGIDIIITDHHEPTVVERPHYKEDLPDACAIIDHKQKDCPYPDKNLCGTAVAFKFIQAILKKERFGLKDGHEKWFLDLVGLATLSDMVPLVGENRIFAYFGLQVMKRSQRKGLNKLFEKLNMVRRHINEDDIAFMITPRINAASRMGIPMDAFSLLAAQSDEEALKYVIHLNKINDERKGVVASLVKEIKKTVYERYGQLKRNSDVIENTIYSMPSVIVLGNPAWRPALLGLAANSCAEEFDRPVFLWGRDGDNVIKGSCRSEGRTHIVELMRAVSPGVFIQYGGHKHSGGFAVSNSEIHYLEQRLNDAFSNISKEILNNNDFSIADIDMELHLDDINWNMWNDIEKISPFGASNHKPIFLFRKIMPLSIRRFGKKNEHVEIKFNKSNNEKISAVSFFGIENDWFNHLNTKKAVDLTASLEKSFFRDKQELRLRIVEIFVDEQ